MGLPLSAKTSSSTCSVTPCAFSWFSLFLSFVKKVSSQYCSMNSKSRSYAASSTALKTLNKCSKTSFL